MMHVQTHIKFTRAKQAKDIHEYKNTKRQLYKTIAAIWYNKTSTDKHLSLEYISIKIKGRNRQCTNTLRAATHYRLKQEIKFLYIKKNKLNEHLYAKHLECATTWPTCWATIHKIIDNNLQLEMETHFDKLNRKLDNVQTECSKHKKHQNHNQQQSLYPRTVNLSSITFTKEEQELLDLGMQHSIQQPIEAYWTNLILETEHALRLVDPKFQDAYRLMATKKLKQIHNANHNSTVTHKRHSHIAKNIHHKLDKNNAMITQADKGKTTVIIYEYKQDYRNNVHTFLLENNFQTLPNNPTKKIKHISLKLYNNVTSLFTRNKSNT